MSPADVFILRLIFKTCGNFHFSGKKVNGKKPEPVEGPEFWKKFEEIRVGVYTISKAEIHPRNAQCCLENDLIFSLLMIPRSMIMVVISIVYIVEFFEVRRLQQRRWCMVC